MSEKSFQTQIYFKNSEESFLLCLVADACAYLRNNKVSYRDIHVFQTWMY